MNFNQIVLEEAARGRAIFKGIHAQGGTITNDMRNALRQLNMLAVDVRDGEVLDKGDAARAVNLADYLAESADGYANGKFWSYASNAAKTLGKMAGLKLMVAGLVLMALTFMLPGRINLSQNITAQVSVVAVAIALLALHSFLCAGAVIGNKKAGLFREFAAACFFLIPVLALWGVIEDSSAQPQHIVQSTYRVILVSFYFGQGVIAFAFGLFASADEYAAISPAIDDSCSQNDSDMFDLYLIDPDGNSEFATYI